MVKEAETGEQVPSDNHSLQSVGPMIPVRYNHQPTRRGIPTGIISSGLHYAGNQILTLFLLFYRMREGDQKSSAISRRSRTHSKGARAFPSFRKAKLFEVASNLLSKETWGKFDLGAHILGRTNHACGAAETAFFERTGQFFRRQQVCHGHTSNEFALGCHSHSPLITCARET